MARIASWSLLILCFLYFAVGFIWPLTFTLHGAFFDADQNFSFAYLLEIFKNPIYLEGMLNAFLIASGTTLLSAALAIPLAMLADKYTFPGKVILTSLILVPLILPPFVGAIGIKQILGQYGALNAFLVQVGLSDPEQPIHWLAEGRMFGIILMNALHLYPILYLNVSAALANIDPAMGEAAENLGSHGFQKWRRVTFPLMMPGLFAGGTLVFIWAFTDLGVPLIFDFSRVTPVQIFYGVKEISGNPVPYALVVVMLGVSTFLYFLSTWLFGRKTYAMASKSGLSREARPPGAIVKLICLLVFSGISFLAILPHIGVILLSFSEDWYRSILPTVWTGEHYLQALGHQMTVPSIANSLRYAGLATLIDLVMGLIIALLVVRSRLPGRRILDALSILPLAVPGLVLAFGYLAMTQEGRLFDFLNPLRNPTLLLAFAYSMRRIPYVVRAAVAGLQQTSISFEEAAANLGAGPVRVLRRITLPLISANLIAGGILAFSFAMLEVSDSLLLAQRAEDYPITKAIFDLFQLLGEGRFLASALGVWAMVFLALTMFSASILMGRKLGAIFRT